MALRPRATPSPVGHALELGLQIGGSVLIGMAIGYYLDRWLGTDPWLLLLFLVFGFVAALRTMIRFMRRSETVSHTGPKTQQVDAAPGDEPGSDA